MKATARTLSALAFVCLFLSLPKFAGFQPAIAQSNVAIDTSAEYDSGMIPQQPIKYWYVWINTSGTQLIYYAMLSDIYNPPIMSFIGQHFKTENGVDVFVGNTKALLEVYDDKNADGIPQGDFASSEGEILYYLVTNSSATYELIPLEKIALDGVNHYTWGITYRTIDGFLFHNDRSGLAFKVGIEYIQFKYDFYVLGNASYTKTSFAMSELASYDQNSTDSIPTLEGLSLSLLYSTSTASPKAYTPFVNGEPYDSSQAEEAATPTLSGQILVEDVKAYEFLFDESYNLTRGDVEQYYEVRSEAAALSSVPTHLTLMTWVFNNLENVLNADVLFPSAVGPGGRVDLNVGASKFLYRICYPTWSGGAVEHDPTGIAYFHPTSTQGSPNDGSSNGLPTIWIVASVAVGAVIAASLLAFSWRRKRQTR